MELSLSQAEPLVVDSSVIAASFIPDDEHHTQGREVVDGLDRGDYVFHLPMLAVVEVSAAIRRRMRRWLPTFNRWQARLAQWEREGKVILYPMNRERMKISVTVARERRLRGADSVVAALAEELNLPLRTFDSELLVRGPGASL